MKNLLEISHIVSKKKVRKIEILDAVLLDAKGSKFVDFYDSLMAGKFKNDRDAATYLYKCSPTHDKYRQLKSRFRRRLLNTLFFLDMNMPTSSSYDRAYFSCHKDWTLVRILSTNGAVQTAGDYARQILTVALKFRFADIVVNAARLLRQLAAESENEKDFGEYDGYVKEFSTILDAEMHSEELFQKVLLKFRIPKAEISQTLQAIDDCCHALVELSEQHKSPVIVYNMYLAWVFRYEMERDFDAMLEVCTKAEKYIEDNPLYYQDDMLATFQVKKMSAYLHQGDFKNGKVNAEKCLQSFTEGTEIWFHFMEYYILLAYHTGNYLHALAIFNRANDHSKFNKLGIETRERWKIYEVYLHYFLDGDIEEDEQRVNTKKVFRLKRFLNDPILYPREQRVYTVHLVVAQMLFQLKRNSQGALECIERMRMYANKQLLIEENYRMVQFLKLLSQLGKANLHPEEMHGHEKYYERLLEHPFFYRGLLSDWEIVPYEKLWNHVLAQVSSRSFSTA
ncbi:MAG: hypothetical protein EPO28_12920 [Saprospiraceae bacterium]|nr:MAG: hypothetical protein EPO28_12920 [Saprospiraceae bacterium]